MAQVMALATRSMEAVEAPGRLHVDSGPLYKAAAAASSSVTSSLLPDGDGQSSPASLMIDSSVPRSAFGVADTDLSLLESPSVNTIGAQKQDAVFREAVCLCTPAIKIPRPRNAFILYRQHHQAQVTADNPKLSNPDISKIIGEKWKNESGEVKQNWKKLAEEEKQRHQNQYPNYRYQPRRGNKPQASWAANLPGEENGRCTKCNGRTSAAPQTPTPFAKSPAGKVSMGARGLPSLQMVDPALSRRASFDQSPTNGMQFHSGLGPFRDLDHEEQPSPEMKRRRANGAGGYHIVNGVLGAGYGGRQIREGPLTPTEAPPPASIRTYPPSSLPDLGALKRSQSGPMHPPLQPMASPSWVDKDRAHRRHSGFDESLRLPPLQVPLPPSPSRTPSVDGRRVSLPLAELGCPPSREGGSVRDVVMSMPLARKISVLASICQPVPGQARTPEGIRGAFIAVEGPDATLLREAGRAIEKGLGSCGEIDLQVWGSDPQAGHLGSRPDRAGPPGLDQCEVSDADGLLEAYLRTMLSWQEKSKQIVRHVTGRKGSSGGAGGAARTNGTPRGPSALADGTLVPTEEERGSNRQPARTPVALVKEGFSLTISDRYACGTPIPDRYTPIDHWQWLATLWRGTACPDLIVYVAPSEASETSNRSTVEFSRRMGLIVVNAPGGKGLDEATERRMAFEVMEWMRDGSFREGLPKGWRAEGTS